MVACVILWVPTVSLAASAKDPGSATRERDKVREQIEALKKAINQTSEEKKRAAQALRTLEQKLEQTNAKLGEIGNEIANLEVEIVDLGAQEIQAKQDLQDTQDRLAKVLRNQYRRAEINPTQAWLAGQSAGQAARESYWFERISSAEKQLAEQQTSQAEKLESIREKLERRQDRMEESRTRQNRVQRELAAQKEERNQLIEDLNSKLKDQELEKKRLERDEARLTNLITQLAKAIEEARRKAAEAPEKPKPGKKPGRKFSDPPPPMPSTGEFASLKGKMVLPAQGTVVGQFGRTRSKDGQGPSWKGIFISTDVGQPVRAVAAGRVVFSEWLRGFGEIVILDHGDQFLSVYGNNSKLLKRAGDSVKSGEVVAETGNSSGNLETGLYFELRQQGQPFDPLSWTRGQ